MRDGTPPPEAYDRDIHPTEAIMLTALTLFTALLVPQAQAQDTPMSCWGVTGWSTPTGAQMERASLIPTSCHETASNTSWIRVQQLLQPLPEAIWLKVLDHDPHVTNGEFFMTPVYVGQGVNGHPIVELAFFYNHSNLWPLQDDPPDPCGDRVSFFDGSTAPGTWDSANCWVDEVPSGTSGFVYNNSYYLEPEPGIVCDLGTSDGANCWIGPMPANSSPVVINGLLYITRPAGGTCDMGYPAASTYCLIGAIEPHADPFLFKGQLYVESSRECVDGEYDGANCYLGTAPAGHRAFVWPDANGAFYYTL